MPTWINESGATVLREKELIRQGKMNAEREFINFEQLLEQDERDPAAEKRTGAVKRVPKRDRGSQGPITPFGKLLSDALKEGGYDRE